MLLDSSSRTVENVRRTVLQNRQSKRYGFQQQDPLKNAYPSTLYTVHRRGPPSLQVARYSLGGSGGADPSYRVEQAVRRRCAWAVVVASAFDPRGRFCGGRPPRRARTAADKGDRAPAPPGSRRAYNAHTYHRGTGYKRARCPMDMCQCLPAGQAGLRKLSREPCVRRGIMGSGSRTHL